MGDGEQMNQAEPHTTAYWLGFKRGVSDVGAAVKKAELFPPYIVETKESIDWIAG